MFVLHVTLIMIDTGSFTYEFYATSYPELGNFYLHYKRSDLAWPSFEQDDCSPEDWTRPYTWVCDSRGVQPGRYPIPALQLLARKQAGQEFDFRVKADVRAGGAIYSNTLNVIADPDTTPISLTDNGIKAWRTDTAGRVMVEWNMEQSCPAGERFHINFGGSGWSRTAPGEGRGRLISSQPDSDVDSVSIGCARNYRSSWSNTYATADIAALNATPVVGAEITISP